MKTIEWGKETNSRNSLGNLRLSDLYLLVTDFRLGRLPLGWSVNRIFENRQGALPNRAHGHYREFYLGVSPESGSLHVVLGRDGEVYVKGEHYRDFIQVLNLPFR